MSTFGKPILYNRFRSSVNCVYRRLRKGSLSQLLKFIACAGYFDNHLSWAFALSADVNGHRIHACVAWATAIKLVTSSAIRRPAHQPVSQPRIKRDWFTSWDSCIKQCDDVWPTRLDCYVQTTGPTVVSEIGSQYELSKRRTVYYSIWLWR